MIKFERHPDIALSGSEFATGNFKAQYEYDYVRILEDITSNRIDERATLRTLFTTDLWFLVNFGLNILGNEANHPFIVRQCQTVQDGPKSDTLDIWARYHWKSTVITVGETLQYHMKNPEHCTSILCYNRPTAKKPLRAIKRVCEESDLLKWCFPEVFWEKPETQAPKWSLASDTPVITTEGWKSHGDLVVGDKIFGSKGQVITVIGNSGPMQNVECRRVVFSDTELIASSEHLWPVEHKSYKDHNLSGAYNGVIKILPTDKLPVRSKVRRMLPTPIIDMPIQKEDITVNPYILGLWLGDGTSGTNIISMHRDDEKELLSLFTDCGYEYYIHRRKENDNFSMYGLRGLKEQIELLGCLRKKHIPKQYLFGNAESRLLLLQGLMDSDGTCKKDGPNRCKGMCMFSNTNNDLADGVFFLASSFGLRPSRINFMPKTRGRQRVNHIYFVGIKSIPPFLIKRKVDRCNDAKHQNGRYVHEIENIESVTVNCIKVDAEDHLYLAGAAMVPTHNSEDDGIVFKRKSSSRPQSTVEAHGLVEGMPIGSHYERLVFDDLETDDIKESPDMLEKVFRRFEMAEGNLGMGKDSDIVRIIGTYYSHFGPNVRIRDMKYPDGRNIYELRLMPATDDGTRDGKPVYMESKPFEKEKTKSTFNSQQLCNPTPTTSLRLDKNYLKPIDRRFVPRNIMKFMVIDQAGGDETNKQSTDMWSYGIIGVEPCIDEVGQSNIYIMDIEADKMSHSEGINGIVTMYLRNGIIEMLGCEKVGLSTTEIHIANALRVRGRRVSLEAGNLFQLRPGGRSKESRIENNLQWPLNNGKVYYCDDLEDVYINKLKDEMDKFPFFHVDILDMIAYVYDMMKEFDFAVKGQMRTQHDDIMDAIKKIEGHGSMQNNPLYHGLQVVG